MRGADFNPIQGNFMLHSDEYAPQSPYATGLSGRCPRCGEGKMFNGFLSIAPRCEACGLDLKFADAGDGPAFFVMLIAGFILMGLALYVQLAYEPPVWLLMLIFTPLTLGLCIGMLRPLKGLLVALQYHNKAEQGRLEK
jgi:uncharacterized protein (DUF983 family)